MISLQVYMFTSVLHSAPTDRTDLHKLYMFGDISTFYGIPMVLHYQFTNRNRMIMGSSARWWRRLLLNLEKTDEFIKCGDHHKQKSSPTLINPTAPRILRVLKGFKISVLTERIPYSMLPNRRSDGPSIRVRRAQL